MPRSATTFPASLYMNLNAYQSSDKSLDLCFSGEVSNGFCEKAKSHMSRNMRFPTMWYVRPESLRSACSYAQSDQSLC